MSLSSIRFKTVTPLLTSGSWLSGISSVDCRMMYSLKPVTLTGDQDRVIRERSCSAWKPRSGSSEGVFWSGREHPADNKAVIQTAAQHKCLIVTIIGTAMEKICRYFTLNRRQPKARRLGFIYKFDLWIILPRRSLPNLLSFSLRFPCHWAFCLISVRYPQTLSRFLP